MEFKWWGYFPGWVVCFAKGRDAESMMEGEGRTEGRRRRNRLLLLFLASSLLALIVLSHTHALPSSSLLDSTEETSAGDGAPEETSGSESSQRDGATRRSVVTVISQPYLPVAAELQHVQAILKKLKSKISSFQKNEEDVGKGLKQSIDQQKEQVSGLVSEVLVLMNLAGQSPEGRLIPRGQASTIGAEVPEFARSSRSARSAW
eukprot:507328-Hanusia_phi.AAC.6